MSEITARDRERALRCMNCKPCKYAQRKQKGLVFWFVQFVESRLCPFCRAYEKVYGRKPHQPPESDTAAMTSPHPGEPG